MTDAARPAVQRRFPSPPAARRSRNAMSSRSPHRPSSRRAHPRRPHPRPKKLVVSAPDKNTGRPFAPAATSAIRPRSSNPHRARPTKQRPSSPRFPPYEAFKRRPRAKPRAPAKGRRPKPFSKAAVRDDGPANNCGQGRVPDGKGRRRHPAAHHGTAAAVGQVNSVASSICHAFDQKPREFCVLMTENSVTPGARSRATRPKTYLQAAAGLTDISVLSKIWRRAQFHPQ